MKKELGIPSVKDFRNSVDVLGKNRNSLIIKTLYLTASRSNEFLTKISPSDEGLTKALGKLVTCHIERLDLPNLQYKAKAQHIARMAKMRRYGEDNLITILVLKIPVLKQKKNKKHPERQQPQKFKLVALPCEPEFESWTVDLLKWIRDHDKHLCFDLTRQTVLKIVKRELGFHPHHLRHIRVTHLVNDYQFTGEQVSLVTGWTMRSGFGFLGQNVSPRVNIYLHSQWTNYIHKLLVPLDLIKKGIITIPAVNVGHPVASL